MIDTFCQYLSTERRLSKHTLIAYKTDLLQLQSFAQCEWQCETIESLNFQDLRAWVSYLTEQKIDSRSVNRKIATVKSFFKFLLKRNLVETNPSLNLKSLKIAKKLPSFVKQHEMEIVFDADIFTNDFAGLRDKLVIELLYGTGIRLAELLGLKVSDVNFYEMQIKVLGKRSKQRYIPLHKSLATLLKQYLSQKGDSTDTLIVTDKAEPAYPVFIQRITKKYLIGTNLQKTSPHVLRHTFATHLLNEGADLNAIKDILGHSSLAATQVYTHNSIKKLKDIHKLAHPKA